MPGNRNKFDPKNIFSIEYKLYLMCQHPVQPHIVSGPKGYDVPKSKEWWGKVAPWFKRLVEFLKYIPKAGPFIKGYNEQFYKDIENSLKIFDTVLDNLPDISHEDSASLLRYVEGRFQAFDAEGPALRALHSYLKEVDKEEKWCGLNKVVTNDGNIFWLCEKHQKLHKIV